MESDVKWDYIMYRIIESPMLLISKLRDLKNQCNLLACLSNGLSTIQSLSSYWTIAVEPSFPLVDDTAFLLVSTLSSLSKLLKAWEGRMSNKEERSYIMIKPDGVQRGLIGRIIARFEDKGFKLIGLKLVNAQEDVLNEHYEELKVR